MLTECNRTIAAGHALTPDQLLQAMDELVSEKIEASEKADFLIALARRGETFEEIAIMARYLRGKAVPVPLNSQLAAAGILDVCGTGGDHLNTFNISTTVALLAAAAGVPVAKHGNRAITSQSGSADVLEALGIPIDLSPEEAAVSLEREHFAFFFAQKYHPVFKHIGPARKICAERGQRTVFNFLGPMLNPTHPSAQLVGVPRPELCPMLARVLQELGTRRAMVVCGTVPDPGGEKFTDEISTLGKTHLSEFYHAHGFHSSVLSPEHYPLQKATLADLKGGDKNENASLVRSILEGKERGPKREAVLMNAGAALFVAGRSEDLIAGWELARETIDSGKAAQKLKALVKRN